MKCAIYNSTSEFDRIYKTVYSLMLFGLVKYKGRETLLSDINKYSTLVAFIGVELVEVVGYKDLHSMHLEKAEQYGIPIYTPGVLRRFMSNIVSMGLVAKERVGGKEMSNKHRYTIAKYLKDGENAAFIIK